MSKTKIDWATDAWNPVTGCTPAGAGCANCYAKGIAKRFWGDRKFSDVQCHHNRLNQPLLWKKPRKIFVSSMGDLFHKDVTFSFVDLVMSVIWRAKQHQFIVLTKRPERMREYFAGLVDGTARERLFAHRHYVEDLHGWCLGYRKSIPIQNLILGVSCSNQAEVDRAVPLLLDTPAACRCVSLEPLLGPVDVSTFLPSDEKLLCGNFNCNWTGDISEVEIGDGGEEDRRCPMCNEEVCYWVFEPKNERPPMLDWVIVGGESGRNARPMYSTWAKTVRDQCKAAGTAFFFKQWGEWVPVHQTFDRSKAIRSCGAEYMNCAGSKAYFFRVGKTSAGHLLDGKEHREVPEVRE